MLSFKGADLLYGHVGASIFFTFFSLHACKYGAIITYRQQDSLSTKRRVLAYLLANPTKVGDAKLQGLQNGSQLPAWADLPLLVLIVFAYD